MFQRPQSLSFAILLGLAASTGFTSCSGSGGGDSADAAAQEFNVEFISVGGSENNFQLNRPIQLRFNRAVDPMTITPNTINIAVADGETVVDPADPSAVVNIGGLPAIGEFISLDERTVVFQPACPTSDDLSSGGLLPGVRYTINIPSETTNGISLAAMNGGQGLDQGFTLNFRTSDSTDPSVVFLDTSSGPPMPIIRTPGSTLVNATRLELANDPTNRVYFERASVAQPAELEGGFIAPLNLYSAASTQVDVVIEIDQPINPSPNNVSNERIGVEFRSSPPGALNEVWTRFESIVTLERNCTESGSRIRVSPQGPLPQDRPLRIFVSPLFEDLIGQTSDGFLTDIAQFDTSVALDPITGLPGDTADEVLERFDVNGGGAGSFEDVAFAPSVPRAPWSLDGKLRSAFEFDGTGGPSSTFDIRIPPATDFVFNTTSQLFTGGPGMLETDTQVAIDGVLDCRSFFLPASSTFRIAGPNTARILATETVRIEGEIFIVGNAARPIFTLNTANLPEPGASGNGGGGQGGTGSQLTTQVTPRGSNGRGAFQLQNGGGQGGESGFTSNDSNNGENRRPGGGGGGTLGADVTMGVAVNGDVVQCRNQDLIGLDAEPGMRGNTIAMGAVTMASPPQGGSPGPRPFSDNSDQNDFWGNLLVDPDSMNPSLIRGELPQVWAGAGGGAGGDATRTAIYPPAAFQLTAQDKGAGGGGGAGGLVILALGNISFGPQGRITATGGTGAGGENTSFVNRVGGGSGGGSGGHIVLQTASQIDFSEVAGNARVVTALGGQGGAGAGNLGGFDLNPGTGNGVITPENDSKPFIQSEIDMGCDVPDFFRVCAGGDGGPGLIQLHAPNTASLIPPLNVSDFRNIIVPRPVGLDLDDNEGQTWDGLMQPLFGRLSRARSVWIPLGGVHVDPGGGAAEMIEFLFQGVDPVTGDVQTVAGLVPDQPTVLNGVFTPAPALPYRDVDGNTIVVDLTLLAGANDIYRRNPSLMRLFEVEITSAGLTESYQVASVDADETTGELRLSVEGANQPLASVGVGDSFEIIPRFFRVSTDGNLDELPDSASISISFQAAPADMNGNPDTANATLPVSDPAALNLAAGNEDFRFFRFIVDFDIAADGSSITASTPLPGLEFLRFPFKF